MSEHVRSSAAKQEALIKLMRANPGLMGSFDDELLASLTLASTDPAVSDDNNNCSSHNKRGAAAAAKHTLIDPRLSYDRNSRVSATRASTINSRHSTKTERVNVCLYTEDNVKEPPRTAKKQVLLHQPSPAAAKSSANKSNGATLITTTTAAGSTTAKDDKSRNRSNVMAARESARYPQKLVSLLDENVFTERGTLKASPQQPQQQPLPPSVAPIARTAKSMSPNRTSNISSNSKPKANNRRWPQPAVSIEQQYEFGRTTSYSSGDSDAIGEQSAHSSSHGSNESDESCASMSSVSMDNSSTSNSSSPLPPTSATYSRQKSSQMVLDHRCFVSRDQWVDRSSRRSCSVCERYFGVWRKRHTCRMCGEVICSRCSVFRTVNLSVVEGKCRICSCCSVSYRKKLEDLVNSSNMITGTSVSSEPVVLARSESSGSGAAVNLGTLDANLMDTAPSQRSSTSEPGQLSSAEEDPAGGHAKSSSLRYDSDLSTLLSSDYSSSLSSSESLSSFSFSSRNIEEELEAALKARQLEKEVEASRNRIQELEVKIQDQENQKELLSSEQQSQLAEARTMIQQLQEKLRQQELSAREAAMTRDTICLTNLRQVEVYTSDDDESRALKKKLQILERQLQQAGINVAEVIPYEVAKAKVAEIARRLQEIGSSELVLDDKHAQAAARKEYYKLEQDMEKYNTALVMTDEYIEEERHREARFEDEHYAANERALLLLRSAIPVDISRLSEHQLKTLVTPSGNVFPADLAKRLKRTNVLQLLRVDPKDIVRMHPSVIEGYRTTGLTLLERRALHVVMQRPFMEWKRQQMDEMSLKKFQWYKKLRDALESAVLSYTQHCETSGESSIGAQLGSAPHSCKLLGLSCPVRAEMKVEKLYASELGFPQHDAYFTQEVIKSDPEGAGEKALQEAQSYAREMIANQRQRELKAHYKMNMREVTQAMGALEELDVMLERVKTLDAAFVLPGSETEVSENKDEQVVATNDCDVLLQVCRELVLLLAKRAGICVVGKRNRENDEQDTRSPIERQAATEVVAFLCLLLEDIREFYTKYASGSLAGALRYVLELLEDVKEKNASAAGGNSNANGSAIVTKRVPWQERSSAGVQPNEGDTTSEASSVENGENAAADVTSASPASKIALSRPPVLPTSASLFDAIRARKQLRKTESDNNGSLVDKSPSESAQPTKAVVAAATKPVDLLAAIRARQLKSAAPAHAEAVASYCSTTTSSA